MVLKTKFEWSDPKLFRDGAFYGYDDFDSLYEHWKLLDGVIEYFRNLAASDSQNYKKLSANLLSSKAVTLLTIVIKGWNQVPQNYIEQILQFLEINDLLKEYSHFNKSFGIEVRKLISNIYVLLDDSQKNNLDKNILSAEPESEKTKESLRYRGINQYRLLWAIPEDERNRRLEINRKYLELERKFGKCEEDKIEKHDHKMSFVGPPLPDSAYKNMTFDQWLETFKEFNDSTGWDAYYHNPRGFHKGGLVEHSRAFGACIKSEPNKYFPFVQKLVTEAVSESYLSEALRALTEIKYDPIKLKTLVLSLGTNLHSTELRRNVIAAIRYISGEKSIDKGLLDILEEYALRDPDPAEEIWIRKADGGKEFYGGDPLHHGINSVRGSAVEALVLIG